MLLELKEKRWIFIFGFNLNMLAALFLFSFDPVKRERSLFYFLFSFIRATVFLVDPVQEVWQVSQAEEWDFLFYYSVSVKHIYFTLFIVHCVKNLGYSFVVQGETGVPGVKGAPGHIVNHFSELFYLLNSIYDYFKAITDAFLCIRMKKKMFHLF